MGSSLHKDNASFFRACPRLSVLSIDIVVQFFRAALPGSDAYHSVHLFRFNKIIVFADNIRCMPPPSIDTEHSLRRA